jgi:uncharacterized protein with HEPN domain
MPRDPSAILREDRIPLTHMVDSAKRALRISTGLTAATLAADEVRMLAIVKSIEVVGEASTKVSEATMKRLATIDWQVSGRCATG